MLATFGLEMPRKIRSLKQARLELGMSYHQLSTATGMVLGDEVKVHLNQIWRAEHGHSITERTAVRILTTINTLHRIRGKPECELEDLALNISMRGQAGPDQEEQGE